MGPSEIAALTNATSVEKPIRVYVGLESAPDEDQRVALAMVAPGKFDAKGHDDRRDLVPFFNAVLGFRASPELVDQIVSRLETQELNRTRWIASRTAAGSSLAAAVAIRWMEEERKAGRDPDVALEASVFALVEQMQAEDIHT